MFCEVVDPRLTTSRQPSAWLTTPYHPAASARSWLLDILAELTSVSSARSSSTHPTFLRQPCRGYSQPCRRDCESLDVVVTEHRRRGGLRPRETSPVPSPVRVRHLPFVRTSSTSGDAPLLLRSSTPRQTSRSEIRNWVSHTVGSSGSSPASSNACRSIESLHMP